MSTSSSQVIIEGVAGMTVASNIAVDDITFSTNLTCVSVGKPTPPETFESNVFLILNDTAVHVHLPRFTHHTRRNPDPKYQAILYIPIPHNALCLPPKFCISYCYGRSAYSQEYFITIVYAKLGGQTECIMGNWKIENYNVS